MQLKQLLGKNPGPVKLTIQEQGGIKVKEDVKVETA